MAEESDLDGGRTKRSFGERESPRERTYDFDDHSHRHDEYRNETVGNGQGHEEVVGGILQFSFSGDGQTNENVAGGRDEND